MVPQSYSVRYLGTCRPFQNKIPTAQSLVIVGELDEETPVAYAAVLHDGLANSTMVVLPGIGHLSPSEDPALFNSHVARFLAAS